LSGPHESDKVHLPVYALNVFVPLVDTNEQVRRTNARALAWLLALVVLLFACVALAAPLP
jgi:hypothetical protein